MSPTTQMFVWMSYTLTMIITSQVIPALAKWLVTSDASSTGPDSSDLSPTMYSPARPAAEANQSTTNLSALFGSSRLPYDPGIQFPWTS